MFSIATVMSINFISGQVFLPILYVYDCILTCGRRKIEKWNSFRKISLFIPRNEWAFVVLFFIVLWLVRKCVLFTAHPGKKMFKMKYSIEKIIRFLNIFQQQSFQRRAIQFTEENLTKPWKILFQKLIALYNVVLQRLRNILFLWNIMKFLDYFTQE